LKVSLIDEIALKIIWIKPLLDKKYTFVEKNLKGAIEYYVIFNDNSPEIYSSQEFRNYINKIVQDKIKYLNH